MSVLESDTPHVVNVTLTGGNFTGPVKGKAVIENGVTSDLHTCRFYNDAGEEIDLSTGEPVNGPYWVEV